MISTKGRYALRLVVELAKRPREELVPLNEVAQQQNISEKYLEAIVRRLVASEILEGQRGRGGGYRLKRPPEECSAGDILAVMEGTLVPVACMKEGAPPCERRESCSTLPLWQRFYHVVQDFFSSVTIADLAADSDGAESRKPRGCTTDALLAGFEHGAGI